MLPALTHNTSYTHAWELFSKLLFLDATVKKHGSLLCVVGTPEIQKKYLTLAKDLRISCRVLESYHDIWQLQDPHSNILYIITVDEIEKELVYKIISWALSLKVWDTHILENILTELQDFGYEFHEYHKASSFTRKWDTLSITFPNEQQYSVSFWWNEIESLRDASWDEIERLEISSLRHFWERQEGSKNTLLQYLQEKNIFCILDALEFHPQYENLVQKLKSSSFDILGNNFFRKYDLWIRDIVCHSLEELREILSSQKSQVIIYTRHKELLSKFLDDNNFSHIQVISVVTHTYKSFQYASEVYVCDDILSKIFIKKRSRRKLSADVDLLLKIQRWDYIVHIDHWIWVFQWIIQKQLWNIQKEYLEIHYRENDKLFVPITEVARVSKYVGSENPSLTPLSGKIWEKKMKKIHEDIREIAEWLLKNFAERKLRTGNALLEYKQEIAAFQWTFPYSYTHDQAAAIEDIFWGMLSDKNMDRLIVGDVGFGKTEIAFNAAYLALLNKKQVLFLSPLVVLTHEHYHKARERFQDFWINIWVLTRLQSQREVTQTLKGLADGSVDMVIGTHRLLSEKTLCKNLGLMIVDEEHKFWVVDKEKIKNMKSDIDILSLSATPIPRSLNLALAGVRDISLLKSPPEWRKSIQTYVTQYNEKIIQDAGNTELQRWWQIFFVHNRVANIEVYKKQIQKLFPKKKIIITHWQLPGDELEDRILAFKNKKYDILLSTTVIENGIDFSNVNTIFINECQSFGISQIHQLRGRVWRSDAQWYCYLLYRKEHLDGDAAKRIQTIVDYSYLWAGFELAMKDLEIRWGGDILWVRQSGQSKEIWVSLFLKMLEEKIEDLKNSEGAVKKKRQQTQIDLMMSTNIPDSFFLTETDKLQFYRELELIENFDDLEYLKQNLYENVQELEKIPKSIENLFLLLECQILAQKYKILSIKKIGQNYQIDFEWGITLEEIKAFLFLDKEVQFQVVELSKLRSPTKGFENDEKFIKYVVAMLSKSISSETSKKIRLKRRV